MSDDNKALPGFIWALNAIKYHWIEDVKVILFSPAEETIAKDNKESIFWLEKLQKWKSLL